MTNLKLKKMRRIPKDDIETQEKLMTEGWVVGHLIGTRAKKKD